MTIEKTIFTPEEILDRLAYEYPGSTDEKRDYTSSSYFPHLEPALVSGLARGPFDDIPKSPPSRQNGTLLRLFVSSSRRKTHLLRLPRELMDLVLGQLDFVSLACLASTSLLAKFFVETFRPYRDVMAYAPCVPAALGKTGLSQRFKAVDVHRLLYEKECANCGYFGAFFYLPTCERLCYCCLLHNDAYKLGDEELILKKLHLEKQHIDGLPRLNIRTGPGTSRAINNNPRTGTSPIGKTSLRRRLFSGLPWRNISAKRHDAATNFPCLNDSIDPWRFSFGQAMEVALKVHGCNPKHEYIFKGDGPPSLWFGGWWYNRRVRAYDSRAGAFWSPPRTFSSEERKHGCYPPKKPFMHHWPPGKLGMQPGLCASVELPYIQPDGGIQRGGLLCAGCRRTSDLYEREKLPLGIATSVQPDNDERGRSFAYRAQTMRTREDFLLHVSHCYGGQQLLRNPGAALPEPSVDPEPLPSLPVELFEGQLQVW